MTKYSPAPAYSQDESKLGRCAVETPGPSVDAFACNQTRLLLAVFGSRNRPGPHLHPTSPSPPDPEPIPPACSPSRCAKAVQVGLRGSSGPVHE